MVRSVTRQLEPEFDDETRTLIEGVDRHDAECCPGCGLHKSVIDDPEHNHFTFEPRHCPVCAGQDTYARVIADSDEQAVPKDAKGNRLEQAPETPRPADGRHIYLRRLTPDEVEQRKNPKRKREG